jgi:hypothetical protein
MLLGGEFLLHMASGVLTGDDPVATKVKASTEAPTGTGQDHSAAAPVLRHVVKRCIQSLHQSERHGVETRRSIHGYLANSRRRLAHQHLGKIVGIARRHIICRHANSMVTSIPRD